MMLVLIGGGTIVAVMLVVVFAAARGFVTGAIEGVFTRIGGLVTKVLGDTDESSTTIISHVTVSSAVVQSGNSNAAVCELRVEFTVSKLSNESFIWLEARASDDPDHPVFSSGHPRPDGMGNYSAEVILGEYSNYELSIQEVPDAGLAERTYLVAARPELSSWGEPIPRPFDVAGLPRHRRRVEIDPANYTILTDHLIG